LISNHRPPGEDNGKKSPKEKTEGEVKDPPDGKDRNITARYLFRTQITGTIPTLDYNFIIRLTFLSNVRIMRDESKVGSSCVSEKSERCFMVFPSLRSNGSLLEDNMICPLMLLSSDQDLIIERKEAKERQIHETMLICLFLMSGGRGGYLSFISGVFSKQLPKEG
jgi:hypothetical protein|tara:strand:+ start:156 stop:653 length:498 start_codon:yes stop_codon:yes gene_type:complete